MGVRKNFEADTMVRSEVLLLNKMEKGQFRKGKAEQTRSRDMKVLGVLQGWGVDLSWCRMNPEPWRLGFRWVRTSNATKLQIVLALEGFLSLRETWLEILYKKELGQHYKGYSR